MLTVLVAYLDLDFQVVTDVFIVPLDLGSQ